MDKSNKGVQVLNLCKTYPSSYFGKSDKDVKVLISFFLLLIILFLCYLFLLLLITKMDKTDNNNIKKAVDNLSLYAEEGDILCILGHNGAGKTTTINMLVGMSFSFFFLSLILIIINNE